MRRRLAAAMEELNALTRGLEDKVEERTEQLKLAGTVQACSFLGAVNRITVDCDGQRIAVSAPASVPVPDQGAPVELTFARNDLHVMEQA